MEKETDWTPLPDKPSSEWTEEEIKEIFLDLFFWISKNRPEWLHDAIEKRREQLKNIMGGDTE
jgi:hypothetical protein